MEDGIFRRLILIALYSPFTYIPAMLGISVSVGSWAVGQPLGVGPAIVGCLAGAACAVTRIISPSEKTKQKIQDQIDSEVFEAREAQLDALDEQLSQDRDTRDEELLRQLRDLAKTFRQDNSWKQAFDSITIGRMTETVSQMFDHCVDALKRDLVLRQEIRDTRSRKIREQRNEELEALIQEVTTSVAELRSVVEELRTTAQSGSNSQLNMLNEQLRSTLETGIKVQQRLSSYRIGRPLEE